MALGPVVTLLVLVAGAPLVAVADDVSRAAQGLSGEIMSPFCPGRVLAACPSEDAGRLRLEIEGRLRAGESRDAIVDDLTGRYGDALLAAPPAHGWGLFAWGAPLLVLGAGGAAAGWWLRRHRVPAAVSPPGAGARVDPAHVAELERLLRHS